MSRSAQGDSMAIASKVTRWDLPTFNWIEIVDTENVPYRYVRRGQAPAGALIHVGHSVHHETDRGVALALGLMKTDGQPVLRQDAPGLPQKIVVQYEQQGWLATCEFEQELAEVS